MSDAIRELSRSDGLSARNSQLPTISRAIPASQRKLDRIVIIDDYTVARGGATALAVLSAKLFRDLGVAVTYICGDGGDNTEMRQAGVTIVPLGSGDLINADRHKTVFTGIHNQNAVRMIDAWIAANDTPYTVYHVHGWSKILSPAVFVSLRPVASRCVVHAHDFFTACPNGAFYDYQAQQICHRKPLGFSCVATSCDKRSYSHKLWRVARGHNVFRLLKAQHGFGKIVLLHEKMGEFLVDAGYSIDRLVTIRNPVAQLSKHRVCAEENDEFVFIGRLDEEKGIRDLIEANARAGTKLCVIGDGPLMDIVKSSSGAIRAVGWQSHEEIGRTIERASALIMPSRYPEPFGLVAIEAARSGLPVIMSRGAFLAEEMEAHGMAISCATNNIEEFAGVLRAFAQKDRQEVKRMSESAFCSSPRLAMHHDQWRDALIAQYRNVVFHEPVPASHDTPSLKGAQE